MREKQLVFLIIIKTVVEKDFLNNFSCKICLVVFTEPVANQHLLGCPAVQSKDSKSELVTGGVKNLIPALCISNIGNCTTILNSKIELKIF